MMGFLLVAHFLFPLHHVDGRAEIHWVAPIQHEFFCALFVQGFCSTFHGANLFAKGKVYETVSLLRTGY